ncbi:MAG: 2,4-dihydroxyhept-2-ene,7-dioic acid aldolase [Deltaproteobacteria bacterium]|nr:2,4-dihydroxyhept-2-ene,7-dioic acid aldolase [Deltaproteobacteria bacterium]
MNKLELRMVDILKELKEAHGALSVRAEFEAEGTKLEELLRLKEVCMVAGLGLTLKIGGCESIRDMLEARIVGVDYLVAPMVESAYAMRKYLQAVNKVFPKEELGSIEILSNIETKTACDNLPEMLKIPEIDTLRGIVIERVDLCFSLGKNDQSINDEDINRIVRNTIAQAKKERNLICTVGGGVSADSLPLFQSLPQGHLDRYETRKVCFSWQNAGNNPEKAILKGPGFEVLWLRNKLGFYSSLSQADQQRMNLIEQRYWKAIDGLM